MDFFEALSCCIIPWLLFLGPRIRKSKYLPTSTVEYWFIEESALSPALYNYLRIRSLIPLKMAIVALTLVDYSLLPSRIAFLLDSFSRLFGFLVSSCLMNYIQLLFLLTSSLDPSYVPTPNSLFIIYIKQIGFESHYNLLIFIYLFALFLR